MKLGDGIKSGQKNVLPEWDERRRLKRKERFPQIAFAFIQTAGFWWVAYRSPPYPPLWLVIFMAIFTLFMLWYITAYLFSYYMEFVRGK